uniref:Uncharacterized protein n=1 Tax=Octopus bimaculoides TaxID=37653 RepID=A0A0L8HQ00_OCTBM
MNDKVKCIKCKANYADAEVCKLVDHVTNSAYQCEVIYILSYTSSHAFTISIT